MTLAESQAPIASKTIAAGKVRCASAAARTPRKPRSLSRTVISVGGGYDPQWSDDGKEIFYLTPGGVLTRVAVTIAGNKLVAGPPRALFQVSDVVGEVFFGGRYAVGANRRFLINRPTGETSSTIGVVVNWPSALTSTP